MGRSSLACAFHIPLVGLASGQACLGAVVGACTNRRQVAGRAVGWDALVAESSGDLVYRQAVGEEHCAQVAGAGVFAAERGN